MFNPTDTTEKGLEIIIEKSLVNAGFHVVPPTQYDRAQCFNLPELWAFLKETQPVTYATIQKRGEAKFLKRLSDQLRLRGLIDVLRKGITDLDLRVQLYYPQPTSTINAKTAALYKKNQWAVTRQLHYSLSESKKSLDMVLFINGLPLVTLELKNPWTNQTVKNAMKQYQTDRDPKEPLFQLGRCLVHLALDPELCYLTTHLRGADTIFLPFNKGHNHGAGNPPNPHGMRSSYVWEEVLAPAGLSNIIEHFALLLDDKDPDTGKATTKLIFPRYHQLRVVRRVLEHARQHGTGQKYLLQHSAGSGKSNSLTWLAHQLVGLHQVNAPTTPVFDSVIVVTDRQVLDRQLRKYLQDFAQVKGVVEAITDGSQHLKDALEGGKKIIITTVQKFPYICNEIQELGARRFAIVIDEAHSSQSGESAAKMNMALSHDEAPISVTTDPAVTYGGATPGEDEPTAEEAELSDEDIINHLVEKRRLLPNTSYFAFTATPKNKTLEVFGQKQADGKFHPFDLYSMKQAIEEEFILDVVQNYTTYESFYKLNKAVDTDPLFETHRAQQKLRAYVESHPESIRAKTKVMADHYHKNVKGLIGGRAKAMVVTKSIHNAIQYYYAFKQYLLEINSPYQVLIAFSGKRVFDGIEVDEAKLNGFPSGEIPARFKKLDNRILVVANKYQTGFDEPLLHTMYVDKKLRDVQAVQTLSRLNRALKPIKRDTFVLDFFNTTDDIKEAFDKFYTSTILSRETDPNKLNDLQLALDEADVYTESQVVAFASLYLQQAPRHQLDALLDGCVENFRQLDIKQQVDFYVRAKSFGRTYAFLSKILPFGQAYWERLYWFLKYLVPKIRPQDDTDGADGILETVELDSYRLSQVSATSLELLGGAEVDPSNATTEGKLTGSEFDSLEAIVSAFNTRHGVPDWMQEEKVKKFMFEELPADLAQDQATMDTFQNSDRQNARITSDLKVENLMQEVIFKYSDLYKKFSDDRDFKRQYLEFIFDKLWQQRPPGPAAG